MACHSPGGDISTTVHITIILCTGQGFKNTKRIIIIIIMKSIILLIIKSPKLHQWHTDSIRLRIQEDSIPITHSLSVCQLTHQHIICRTTHLLSSHRINARADNYHHQPTLTTVLCQEYVTRAGSSTRPLTDMTFSVRTWTHFVSYYWTLVNDHSGQGRWWWWWSPNIVITSSQLLGLFRLLLFLIIIIIIVIRGCKTNNPRVDTRVGVRARQHHNDESEYGNMNNVQECGSTLKQSHPTMVVSLQLSGHELRVVIFDVRSLR